MIPPDHPAFVPTTFPSRHPGLPEGNGSQQSISIVSEGPIRIGPAIPAYLMMLNSTPAFSSCSRRVGVCTTPVKGVRRDRSEQPLLPWGQGKDPLPDRVGAGVEASSAGVGKVETSVEGIAPTGGDEPVDSGVRSSMLWYMGRPPSMENHCLRSPCGVEIQPEYGIQSLARLHLCVECQLSWMRSGSAPWTLNHWRQLGGRKAQNQLDTLYLRVHSHWLPRR